MKSTQIGVDIPALFSYTAQSAKMRCEPAGRNPLAGFVVWGDAWAM